MSETVPCLIRTLAPVHVGADEVYEPLGFVIDEQKSCLLAFEPGDFLMRLPEADRLRFLDICRRGTIESLLEIYRFYHDRRRQAQGHEVAVCRGLVDHYQEVVQARGDARRLQRTLNQFTIHRTAFLAHDRRPYIPGTAVKGALRTAYLNAMANTKTLPTPKDQRGRWDPRTLEQRLLNYNRIDEDPFRLLKVSDFLPVGEVKTKIVYAVNEKKKVSQFAARGPYQILEVIEPGAEFLGYIRLEDVPQALRSLYKIKRFLRMEDIWKAARTFYTHEKEKEDRTLFEISVASVSLLTGNGTVPLRLGRHSGAECVTIAGHRKIKIKKTGSESDIKDHATTLWLAADFHQREKRHQAHLRPFGWVALQKLSPAEAEEIRERESSWQQEQRRTTPVPEIPPTPSSSAPRPKPQEPVIELWDQATLKWDPGRGEVMATWQGKKAYGKGRELVPEAFHKKLFKGKKTVTARVQVENFRIVKIEGT